MITQPLPCGIRTLRFEAMPTEVQERELARLPEELAQERTWLAEAGLTPYADKTAVLGAIASGELQVVPTDSELAFRQYYQDRASEEAVHALSEEQLNIPFLRAFAVQALTQVTQAARARVHDSSTGQEYLEENQLVTVQYSVTSMFRGPAYQKFLINNSSLALDGDSSHLYGTSFDIDNSGYYVQSKDGELIPVNGLTNPHLYSDVPIHALQAELELAAVREELAFITELPDGRGSWHITANPLISVQVGRLPDLAGVA